MSEDRKIYGICPDIGRPLTSHGLSNALHAAKPAPRDDTPERLARLEAEVAQLRAEFRQHLADQHEIYPLAGELGLPVDGRQS